MPRQESMKFKKFVTTNDYMKNPRKISSNLDILNIELNERVIEEQDPPVIENLLKED
jgi:hypothetical protein